MKYATYVLSNIAVEAVCSPRIASEPFNSRPMPRPAEATATRPDTGHQLLRPSTRGAESPDTRLPECRGNDGFASRLSHDIASELAARDRLGRDSGPQTRTAASGSVSSRRIHRLGTNRSAVALTRRALRSQVKEILISSRYLRPHSRCSFGRRYMSHLTSSTFRISLCGGHHVGRFVLLILWFRRRFNWDS